MCGIAGLFHPLDPTPPQQRMLARMTAAMAHRGPDGDGFHTEPHLGFGHLRLAIVDLVGGVQPMATPDGAVTVCFNGEIYNHATLRRELEAEGHHFRTRSDTESLLHGWRAWGLGLLDRLDGMFAFALWDRARGELLIARDRLGEKPVHVAELPDGTVAFASELAGMLALPDMPRRMDPAAAEDFLALGYIPDPATIYAGIRRLPAGHFLLLRRGEQGLPAPCRYWQAPTHRGAGAPPPEQAAAELRRRLDESVRERLMSDVPLGCFLSGGVDSSAVTAFAMAAREGAPLETFTIGFPGENDERPMAAEVARRLGTTHRDEAGTADYIAAARGVAHLFGEPFGDHSAVPTLAVCAMARRHVTVALSGDGGDEVFGGYRRHRWHALVDGIRRFLPAPIRRHAIGALAQAYPKLDSAPRWLRAKHTLTELSLDAALGYYRMVCKIQDARRRALLAPGFRAALGGHDPSRQVAEAIAACDPDEPLLAAQYADIATYLPGDILVKTDRTSMAVSLELRPPLLDHELVAWGVGLPQPVKLSGGVGKQVLRQAMARELPQDLLWGRKRGFADSIGVQFRAGAEAVRARLTGPAMLDAGIFDRGALIRLVEEHAAGADHAQALWQLLVFEGWLAQEAGANAPATPPAAALAGV